MKFRISSFESVLRAPLDSVVVPVAVVLGAVKRVETVQDTYAGYVPVQLRRVNPWTRCLFQPFFLWMDPVHRKESGDRFALGLVKGNEYREIFVTKYHLKQLGLPEQNVGDGKSVIADFYVAAKTLGQWLRPVTNICPRGQSLSLSPLPQKDKEGMNLALPKTQRKTFFVMKFRDPRAHDPI